MIATPHTPRVPTAAPGSSACDGRATGRSLGRDLLVSYTLVWLSTICGWLIVKCSGTETGVREMLGITFHHPPASFAHVVWLIAHNVPLAGWPLLLGLAGADRRRITRALADVLLVVVIAVNTMLVGAAVAAYGARLLAFLPQLPIEWAGMALGATGWLAQRDDRLSDSQPLRLTVALVFALTVAAVLETTCVPGLSS